MKLFRTPNFKRRITDPLSPKRILAHTVGLKMPKNLGILRNPKKTIYNKIYNFFTKKII